MCLFCNDIFIDLYRTHVKLIFLKSWNEWGEGNYMEPDLTFGKGYINALHEALNSTLGK